MFGSSRGHDSGLRRETEVSETPPLAWTQPTHNMPRSQRRGLWRAGLCNTVQLRKTSPFCREMGREPTNMATSMEPGSCSPDRNNLNSGPRLPPTKPVELSLRREFQSLPTAEFPAIQTEEIVEETMTLREKSTERKLRVRTLPAFSAVILGQLIYLLLCFVCLFVFSSPW